MATVIRENIGVLHDKLNVKVTKQDYYPTFEKAIKEYSKKANIPGFRKGMVPAGMVKKMYGPSIFYDEVIKVVQKEITGYLSTEKPEIFGQPLPMKSDLKNIDMNAPEDYEFPFEIGLKPEINIDSLRTTPFTFYKVKVTDEMIDEDIEHLRSRYGKMTEPETVSSDDDVLNVNFTETDAEGNIVENGITKDNSLLVKYFTAAYKEQLTGKKKDDSIAVELDKAFDDKERQWITSDLGLKKDDDLSNNKFFKMTINKIGLVEKRELNEDFFNEVFPQGEIKTIEDFRNKIKDQIQQQWDAQSRVQLHDQIYHSFIDTPLQFPDDFLKRWLQSNSEKEKTMEEVEEEFPSFNKQMKWTLISDKIINENKLEVANDELRENMKVEVLRYFSQMNLGEDTTWIDSYLDRMMKDEKQLDRSYTELITNKLFNWAETQIQPVEQEVSEKELTEMKHHHQH